MYLTVFLSLCLCLSVCLSVSYWLGLKHPLAAPILSDSVPPPQSDHQSPSNVFHRPEIERQQENDSDEEFDEMSREEVREEKVDEEGRGTEEDVKESSNWVPEGLGELRGRQGWE